MRRRALLRAITFSSMTTLSGCTFLAQNANTRANDLTVVNEREEAVAFDLVVTALPLDKNGETVRSTRHQLSSGTEVLENVVDYGHYDLTIAVDGMASESREWHATDCNHMTVQIQSQAVTFDEGEC